MSFTELEASSLGTKEYWDSTYENEIENFKDHGDVGEVWFGKGISKRIIDWLKENVPKTSKIIDIGCGNGILLNELSKQHFQHLVGVDYSENAITLAKNIAALEKHNIQFHTADLLSPSFNIDKFNVIIDKGTYDAICLAENAPTNRLKYLESIYKSLDLDGRFILTSCNWTREELEQQFKDRFKIVHVIPTPQLSFGGTTGNVVVSIVFQTCDK